MELYKMYKRINFLKLLYFVLFLLLVNCSLVIDTIVQPASITGGQVLPVQLNCTISTNQGQTSKLVVAVLVPKVWNVRQNTTITFLSSITTGPQAMSVVPVGQPAPQGNGLDWPTLLANKIGNGKNLLNDWEWVAFYSNIAYAIGGNKTETITVNIQMKTSTDNLMFKLVYLVANDADGLSSNDRYGSYAYKGCFQVNGIGDMIDFCNPQLSTIEPRASLDNDIITASFDASVADNKLTNASQVYLCATGILTDGTKITKCEQTTANQMTALGLSKYRMDIWPRKFFGLNDNQRLASLEYYFTDITGNLKVGYGGGDLPFTYTFKCP